MTANAGWEHQTIHWKDFHGGLEQLASQMESSSGLTSSSVTNPMVKNWRFLLSTLKACSIIKPRRLITRKYSRWALCCPQFKFLIYMDLCKKIICNIFNLQLNTRNLQPTTSNKILSHFRVLCSCWEIGIILMNMRLAWMEGKGTWTTCWSSNQDNPKNWNPFEISSNHRSTSFPAAWCHILVKVSQEIRPTTVAGCWWRKSF